VNAAREKIAAEEALALVRRHRRLVAAKGKKAVTVDLRKEAPDDEALRRLVVGPSGNLRAPTWTRGTAFVVGFHPDAYAEVLGV